MIRQPNRVTMAKNTYTITQHRILNRIIEALQKDMELYNKGANIGQLSLFDSPSDTLVVTIPLQRLSDDPTYYKEVKNALVGFIHIIVSLSWTDKEGTKWTRAIPLFQAVEFPDVQERYSKNVKVKINIDVAKYLLDLNEGFTRHDAEIAFKTRSIYTARIYQFISRYKDKEQYVMPLNEFKSWLGIEDKYEAYYDLKKKVLDVACNELKKISDLYFDYETKKKGKTVTHIIFKIKTLQSEKDNEIAHQAKKDYIISLMKRAFDCKDKHIEKINHILINHKFHHKIINKLVEVEQFIDTVKNDPTKKPINSKAEYLISSLLNEFSN